MTYLTGLFYILLILLPNWNFGKCVEIWIYVDNW